MDFAFRKMHGIGNDFVVIDARQTELVFTPKQIRAISDRKRGIGCDQLFVIEKPRAAGQAYLRIYNPDGSEPEACGNGTRCVASILFAEEKHDILYLETLGGLLTATVAGTNIYSVDMGVPRLLAAQIPLANDVDTLAVTVDAEMPPAVAVNVGNPHAVFFVADAEAIDLAAIGPHLEHNPIFLERANIEFAHIISRSQIRMRVWERSAGITQACGSAACATLVAAVRRRLSERKAELVLDGGSLTIEWNAEDHVIMTGPAATSFTGQWHD